MKKYDNYKDSGIEWIGEIPSHWDFTKLKYVLTIQSGKGITNEQFIENGEFEIYGGNGILGLTNNYSHDGIDLVIGRVGALCGNIRLIKGKKWISDNALVANTSQNYDFIETCLRFLDLNKLANKNAQPLITGTMVKEQYIALPPLQEQTAIANYLDHKTSQIDHLIAKKEQFIKLLEEERVAVINQAVTKGLDPNVPMKDSGVEWLGVIPEHWEVAKFNLFVKIRHGHQFMNYDFTDEGIKIIKITQLHKDGYLDLSKCSFVSHEQLKNYQSILIKENDILMCLTGGTIGKIIRVGSVEEPLLQNYRVGHFSAVDYCKISDDYIFWLMSSESIISQIFFQMRETGQPNIGMDDFGRMRITLPPIMEQEKIVNHINNKTIEISNIISKSKQEIELLKEYKTALISEVVTGKVDVSTSSTQV